MRKQLFVFTGVFLFGAGIQGATAQESMVTSGGNASGSGGSLSYTVGLVSYTTNSDANASVAEGVQQAYEISQVMGVQEQEIDISISTYPNPTQDNLNISFQELPAGNITYALLDANGKRIKASTIESAESTIDLRDQPVGQYLLVITFDDHQQSSYKIIKH